MNRVDNLTNTAEFGFSREGYWLNSASIEQNKFKHKCRLDFEHLRSG